MGESCVQAAAAVVVGRKVYTIPDYASSNDYKNITYDDVFIKGPVR